MFALNLNGVDISYATEDAVGFDIKACEYAVLQPGEWRAISTQLYVDVEKNRELGCRAELQIRPRSGLAFKNGVTVLNAPGTIDPTYPDEIKVILINHNKNEAFTINWGDRIAQGVVVMRTEAYNVPRSGSQRFGGFGSTGV